MSARRQIIAALSEDSLGGIATMEDVAHAEQLVDAHRTEVIAKAIGRLRAIPVDCTALTGPVWYGDGWNSAITCLEEIAEYSVPDYEAYPGELQRLRALALGLRVAGLRKEDLGEVQRLLVIHADHEMNAREKATASAATATPTVFDPLPSYLHSIGHAGSESERGLYAAYRKAIAEVARLQAETGDGEATPDLAVYRASHDSITFGLYTTAAEARKHCETLMRRESPDINLDWIEDEEDGVAEMTAFLGGEECSTGYVVTALEVASTYDEEGDE
ncbi:hypothetical protein [Streptomyces sp. S1D4-20]|uniref:hypothetical protein n=1 Tax=Streptomyces sp. S1D4-20 TaxID=2594462 RepID=UPI0011650C21|nr:hypothetical protein [Streptomyces sp. S1D4-20]QDN57341.1 hypothetical protein FNV67_20155 [Streptomyces sp. S1D4-20]